MVHLEEKKESIIDDYSNGASVSFLSRKYKCAYNTMKKKLIAWGVFKK